MTRFHLIATILFVGAVSIPAHSDTIRGKGTSMNVDAGYGIKINRYSSLDREWIIVNDPSLPVSMEEITPRTVIADRNWIHEITYRLKVDKPVSAIEVRFIPFDIWGEKSQTLTSTTIADHSAGEVRSTGRWRILSDAEAKEHFALVGYVARIKLVTGEILRADEGAVVSVAQEFSGDFTTGDLDAND
ncbi:hypothetical protein BOO69_09490 [Sulfitobacter alexandrii]|uniref:Uncharacterized protein n=1 Tax=Sulfitobacter alexandrii TaxID=1917485 RepID=A0A1J0WH38_9RHOB|nr:hypothetical protein [Sulfitobacter alexandrii]APE43619.1 hypothetical protein BOO69_09490 [Sulfitobacter alexandrii]